MVDLPIAMLDCRGLFCNSLKAISRNDVKHCQTSWLLMRRMLLFIVVPGTNQMQWKNAGILGSTFLTPHKTPLEFAAEMPIFTKNQHERIAHRQSESFLSSCPGFFWLLALPIKVISHPQAPCRFNTIIFLSVSRDITSRQPWLLARKPNRLWQKKTSKLWNSCSSRSKNAARISGHFRNLNWRYLPCIRPM